MDYPTRSFADINGLRLYYEIHGSGRPVVLLHGGLQTIDLMFGPLLPTVAARRQLIAVELQGHGHTADTNRTMSIDQLADDVAALLAHLGIEEADIFGFSLGGLVGWSLVIRHPKVVGRVAVASADYRSRKAAPDEVPRPMPSDATSRPCATPTRPLRPIPRISTPSPRRCRRWSTRTSPAGRPTNCGRCRARRWCWLGTTTS